MIPFQRKRDIPQDAPAWQASLETVVVTLIVFVIGRLASPDDPFFTRASFPWAVLAPLLAGLRHGVAAGAGSSVLLVLGMGMAWRGARSELAVFPLQSALAFLVVGILAGEFANMWRRRTQRLVTSLEYHRLRLEEFTRTYHVLKESFDVLNRQNLTDPHNLREALITFRQQLARSTKPHEPFLGLAESILGLFADFAQIHAAALFAVEEDGSLAPAPAARLGNGSQPSWDDSLLVAALRTKLLTTVAVEFRGREKETQLLAAIPLADVTGRVWGILAIRDMLFSSFQKTILQRMAVLGGHVGDLLAFRRPASDEDDFRRRVERCRSDARQFGMVASALRVTETAPQKTAGLLDTLLEQRRGLDAAYCKKGQACSTLLLLLPLTDDLGLAGYRERLSRMVEARVGGEAGGSEKSALVIEAFVLRENQDFQKVLGFLDTMASGAPVSES